MPYCFSWYIILAWPFSFSLCICLSPATGTRSRSPLQDSNLGLPGISLGVLGHCTKWGTYLPRRRYVLCLSPKYESPHHPQFLYLCYSTKNYNKTLPRHLRGSKLAPWQVMCQLCTLGPKIHRWCHEEDQVDAFR